MIEIIYGQDDKIIKWVQERIPHVSSDGFGPATAIGIMKEGYLIAGIVYHRYQKFDIEMSMASIDPSWATRKILRTMFQYPFQQLGCSRVTATTPKNYKHVRTFLERLNFKLEGVIRKGYGSEDACIYGLLREELKFK